MMIFEKNTFHAGILSVLCVNEMFNKTFKLSWYSENTLPVQVLYLYYVLMKSIFKQFLNDAVEMLFLNLLFWNLLT